MQAWLSLIIAETHSQRQCSTSGNKLTRDPHLKSAGRERGLLDGWVVVVVSRRVEVVGRQSNRGESSEPSISDPRRLVKGGQDTRKRMKRSKTEEGRKGRKRRRVKPTKKSMQHHSSFRRKRNTLTQTHRHTFLPLKQETPLAFHHHYQNNRWMY